MIGLEKLDHRLIYNNMKYPPLYLAFDLPEQLQYIEKLTSLGFEPASLQKTANVQTEIMLGNPRIIAQEMENAPNLKWAHATWAGIEPLLKATRNNYLLSNTRGVFGQLMAEFVLGYILLFEKNILAKLQNQKNNQWDKQPPQTLRNKKIGLLGVGSIGGEVARFAKTFGMVTLGMARDTTVHPNIDNMYGSANTKEFCSDLDYLVCILPNTSETANMVDRNFLSYLPTKTIIFNVGRGATLDEIALSDMLIEGKLRGAVLDVFRSEPLPENDPLWQVPNLFITSHTSAPSFMEDVLQPFLENYDLYLNGKKLKYLVDFNKQY